MASETFTSVVFELLTYNLNIYFMYLFLLLQVLHTSGILYSDVTLVYSH